MASTEIFFEHDRWGHNLAWSAALHVGVTVAIVAYAWIATVRHGSNWGEGGGGSAMGVRMCWQPNPRDYRNRSRSR